MDFNDLGFPSNYNVRLLEQLPARNPDHSFELTRSGSTGVRLTLESQSRGANARLLEVVTGEGNVWIGRFEAGPGGLSGLFATPCPNTLCVVIQGQGYWLPTLQPTSYEVVASVPIKQVLRVPGRDIMLFIDFVRVEAYGPNGFLWQTDALSWDGLQITEVNARWIRGLGWDSPRDCQVEFAVDTSTGMATGGSSPHQYSKIL